MAVTQSAEEELSQAALGLEGKDPQDVLAWTFARFQRVALVASFQADSSVLIDMAVKLRPDLEVITLDTGRLPQETHDAIDRVRERYLIPVRIVSPDPAEVAVMTAQHGTNLFRSSVELRQLCCAVRKDHPLEKVLTEYEAWITGLRRDQSPTRANTPLVAVDNRHGGIAKVAPLAAWTKAQVWQYIRANDVPHHGLYDQGYTSFGCAPCSRATQPGEDERAGRWWWERDGDVKECGIHFDASGRIVRDRKI